VQLEIVRFVSRLKALRHGVPFRREVPPFLSCLDSPKSSEEMKGKFFFVVTGWTAAIDTIDNLEVVLGTKRVPCVLSARPDVEQTHGKEFPIVRGFSAEIDGSWIPDSGEFNLAVEGEIKGLGLVRVLEKKFNLPSDFFELREVNARRKAKKASFIREHLACPQCFRGGLVKTKEALKCANCDGAYDYQKGIPQMLTASIIQNSRIEPTDNISSHQYDPKIQSIIETNPNKWFLDAGSGLRQTYYENVVNLEIVPYWSSDVIGSVEQIPFREETFDGVFSVAVMEHTPNFFRCAENLLRVLKPGGILFCAVPFLQPEHGYPNHFYNMTHEGLLNLFRQKVKFEESGFIDPAMHPLNTLQWFLRIYADGLTDPASKEKFLKTSINEIVQLDEKSVRDTILGHSLRKEEYRKICSGSYFIGTKI
jgi:uncharacterized protein YbaR (Trm112 family)